MPLPKDPAKLDAWRKKMSKIDPQLRVDYFESILTEPQAYFLGFLIADGNAYKNKLELNLNRRDEYIIFQLIKELGLSRQPYYDEKRDTAKFVITCKKLISDLAKWGVVPNKTFITKAPDLPTYLQRHFWRGAFDGDGSIKFPENNLTLQFCGSYELV